jgi:hypothetical protein
MKKEFYPILMGASPQTPGVYRIGEPRINRRHRVVELFIRSLITRRSGRSPALPYPPNEYVMLPKKQANVNKYIEKTVCYKKNRADFWEGFLQNKSNGRLYPKLIFFCLAKRVHNKLW